VKYFLSGDLPEASSSYCLHIGDVPLSVTTGE